MDAFDDFKNKENTKIAMTSRVPWKPSIPYEEFLVSGFTAMKL